MNDNQKLICGIFILLCLVFIGAMEASVHVNSTDVIERLQEPGYSVYTVHNGNVIVDDTDVYIEVSQHTITERKPTEDILLEYNFSNWSVEDQRLLAEMMRQTASPHESSEQFIILVDAAPVHVLEAYIALLDNLGY